jgi:hypothetical protein
VSDGTENRPTGRVQLDLIDEAPTPILAGLERPHDRMSGAQEMGGGVLVRGAVATTDVAAGHAQAEVYPPTSNPQAVLTAVGAGGDLADLVEMAADAHRDIQPTPS